MLRCLSLAAVILCASLILSASPVFAHLMLIEPVEDGLIKVVFDDGTVARHAEVVVYNEKDEEIARGDVDEDGKFSYPEQEAELIVADDGFGHRAEYVVGEDPHEALPRGLTVAIVLAGFCLIAGVFHYRVRKRELKS